MSSAIFTVTPPPVCSGPNWMPIGTVLGQPVTAQPYNLSAYTISQTPLHIISNNNGSSVGSNFFSQRPAQIPIIQKVNWKVDWTPPDLISKAPLPWKNESPPEPIQAFLSLSSYIGDDSQTMFTSENMKLETKSDDEAEDHAVKQVEQNEKLLKKRNPLIRRGAIEDIALSYSDLPLGLRPKTGLNIVKRAGDKDPLVRSAAEQAIDIITLDSLSKEIMVMALEAVKLLENSDPGVLQTVVNVLSKIVRRLSFDDRQTLAFKIGEHLEEGKIYGIDYNLPVASMEDRTGIGIAVNSQRTMSRSLSRRLAAIEALSEAILSLHFDHRLPHVIKFEALLKRLAENGGEPTVIQAIISAIGKTALQLYPEDRLQRALLMKELSLHNERVVQIRATEAFIKIATSLPLNKHKNLEQTLETFRKRLEQFEREGLSPEKTLAQLNKLKKQLRSRKPLVRKDTIEKIVALLPKLPHEDQYSTTSELTRFITDHDTGVRDSAVNALIDVAAHSSLEDTQLLIIALPLVKLLEDNNLGVQQSAIRAIGKISNYLSFESSLELAQKIEKIFEENESQATDIGTPVGDPRETAHLSLAHNSLLEKFFARRKAAVDALAQVTSNLHPSEQLQRVINLEELLKVTSADDASEVIVSIVAAIAKTTLALPIDDRLSRVLNLEELLSRALKSGAYPSAVQSIVNAIAKTAPALLMQDQLPRISNLDKLLDKLLKDEGAELVIQSVASAIGEIIPYLDPAVRLNQTLRLVKWLRGGEMVVREPIINSLHKIVPYLFGSEVLALKSAIERMRNNDLDVFDDFKELLDVITEASKNVESFYRN